MITFQEFMETLSLNKTEQAYNAMRNSKMWIFPKRNISFLILHSAINDGLPNSNRFRFQGNVVKVNKIWWIMCTTIILIFYQHIPF